MLRRAIWNWIENYTAEFTLLCHNQTRIDGSPEILFDIFNSLADTTKRKAIFWPVQTMLLVLCPDIMISQSLNGGRVQNKKVSSSIVKSPPPPHHLLLPSPQLTDPRLQLVCIFWFA